MKQYNNPSTDDWKSNERYQVAYSALQQNKNLLSLNLAKNILSGKYGFMCQYDRKKDADTVLIQEIKRFIVLKETLVGEHLKKIVDLNFRKLNSLYIFNHFLKLSVINNR